jgi:hypothetical protein
MEAKKWYLSKVLWVNFITILGMVIFRYTGVELGEEESTAILAMVNIILRIVTKQQLG